LARLDDWTEFNVFFLAEITDNRPLQHVTFEALNRRDLLTKFGCCPVKTKAFLAKLEELYMENQNQYHNNVHGADVVQGVHCLLSHRVFVENLTDLEMLTVLLAAACHDVRHPGRTNDFRIAVRDELALTYNDISVNENMHCAQSFRLLNMSKYNFLEGLTPAQHSAVRKSMISMILGTDMANHFSNLQTFNKLVGTNGADLSKWDDKQPVLQMILHSADIANPTRRLDLAKRWTDRVLLESFLQGDHERKLEHKISPLCDRETTSKAKCQLGFSKFIVEPNFEALRAIDSEVDEPLKNIRKFQAHWDDELKQVETGVEI